MIASRTLLQIQPSRDNNDLNFVGVYITNDDKVRCFHLISFFFHHFFFFLKLPTDYYHQAMNFHRKTASTIFMVVCDELSMQFCRETFMSNDNPEKDDTRVNRCSTDDAFDFALLASCNATIVSNEMGVLHALYNGGITTVHHPNSDSSYYIPFLMSEQMENWYAISVVV